MAIIRFIPPNVFSKDDLKKIVPKGASEEDVLFADDDEGVTIVFQMKDGGTTTFDDFGGGFHLRRFKEEPGVQGAVKVSEEQPIGSSLFESAKMACLDHIRSNKA